MDATVEIDAGVCGFHTSVRVSSEDDQHVEFDVESGCENISKFAAVLKSRGMVDAYEEISPASDSSVLAEARSLVKGCCAACAVPVGVFKGMQVAAGLALPKDITIRLGKR